MPQDEGISRGASNYLIMTAVGVVLGVVAGQGGAGIMGSPVGSWHDSGGRYQD